MTSGQGGHQHGGVPRCSSYRFAPGFATPLPSSPVPMAPVTHQASAAQCSRETVYEHARKVEERLAVPPAEDAVLAELRGESATSAGARRTRAMTPSGASGSTSPGSANSPRPPSRMGVSLRPIEDLMDLLLSDSDAKAPDHTTLGRWVQEEARQAGPVLTVLDSQCASRVQTLCPDEIFFGGGRPWSGSNPQA